MKTLLIKLPVLTLTLVVVVLASSNALAQTTIIIQNVDPAGVGFNDPTAASPVGGNTGATVGEQRINAFVYAADIWGSTLPPGPTITVRASWDSLLHR